MSAVRGKYDYSPRPHPNLFLDSARYRRIDCAYLAVKQEAHAQASGFPANEIVHSQKGIDRFGEAGGLGENPPIAHPNAKENAQSRH